MSSIVIVPAGSNHLEILAALHATCFPEAWSHAFMARILASPGAFALLACDGSSDPEQPIGLALARVAGDEAEVLTLGTRPDRRRQGAGRRLLQALIDRSRGAGARKVFLEVAEDNAAARALYRSAGFRRVGRRTAYYGTGGSKSDALVLRCDL